MVAPSSAVALRPARLDDIPALVLLEDASFTTDRLGVTQFRHFISGRTACLLVARVGGSQEILAGYVLVLFRSGSRKARIYSIAVSGSLRGQGIGEQLLRAAEQAAYARDCNLMRLEVRPDNAAALAMYEKQGYRPFGRFPGFYEDGTDAIRLEKLLTES